MRTSTWRSDPRRPFAWSYSAVMPSQEPRRPRGRPPKVGRREEILDQAVDVLTVRGLEGLTLAGLAQALDLSTYALTYHFGSKDGLLEAIVLHAEQRLQKEFAVLAAPTEASVAGLVSGYWEGYGHVGSAASTRLWLEIGLMAVRDPERFPGFLDTMVDGWRRLVASLLPGHPDAEQIGNLAFATMSGLEILEAARPGSVDEATLALLVHMFEQALATPLREKNG